MIHRYYREGQKLDVSGLNEITVLIDRSETEMTEIGWNCWRPNLDGPPHKHNDKDQIFYITDGEGIVKLGDPKYEVRPGNIVYVPAGLVHQTITTGDEALCYLLFNVFRTTDKEGHASFADHIEKVKQIRRKQAETGQAEIDDIEDSGLHILPARFIENISDGKVHDSGASITTILLERTQTNRLEFMMVVWPPNSRGPIVAHDEKEQTFFVIEGSGTIDIGGEKEQVQTGDLLFVPRNMQHITETKSKNLKYLCLSSIITELNA